ncbi:hypothetical protein EATG_03901 [Escherichia coli H605]|uniref:DUF1287 domain-containing protein n=2 Tax=Escherichia TaxID=561 RepID=A0AAJ3TY84_ECOLX|nr:hypothetical protein EATG_03901 [Escherichia coli H605]
MLEIAAKLAHSSLRARFSPSPSPQRCEGTVRTLFYFVTHLKFRIVRSFFIRFWTFSPQNIQTPGRSNLRRLFSRTKQMKASLALVSLLTGFTSHSLKSPTVPPTVVQIQTNTNLAIADGARQQIGSTLFYDPAYMQLTYPGGDVPQERGVCSDVVIRALRSQKVDLQKLVHEDMAKYFADYPQKWQLKRPDSNIDHRRVPNLETWFTRHDKTRPTSKNPSDYQAGDIVSWRLDNGLAHIGVVSDGFARDGTPLVIHNIGAGAQEEDVLFSWRIVGHYRYFTK